MAARDLEQDAARDRLLDAALPHVAFDGWGEAAFLAAATKVGMPADLARVICPRGAVDLAVAYHRRGDQAMLERLAASDLGALRFREKITAAVRFRLEGAEREVVRRGAALFALPQHTATGVALIWATSDAIWTALGDTSDDINWYSKRAILAGVHTATTLYWLGDESPDHAAAWAFLDRRIEDVMRFEAFKARVRENKPLMQLLAAPLWLAARVRAPGPRAGDLPGRSHGRRG